MFYKTYTLNDKKVQNLIHTDENLGKLISYIGNSEIAIEEDGFKCLIKCIIGQQISDKARETIWQRVYNSFDDIQPSLILSISDSELRRFGLSGRKIEYIKTLAECIINNDIDFNEFITLSNEEVIKKLITLKGIGQWTAEMYLIFSLGRENVFSKDDGTIRRTVKWMYNLEKLPTANELEKYFCQWTEFATIVTSYFWKAIDLGLLKIPFDEAVANYSLNPYILKDKGYGYENEV